MQDFAGAGFDKLAVTLEQHKPETVLLVAFCPEKRKYSKLSIHEVVRVDVAWKEGCAELLREGSLTLVQDSCHRAGSLALGQPCLEVYIRF